MKLECSLCSPKEAYPSIKELSTHFSAKQKELNFSTDLLRAWVNLILGVTFTLGLCEHKLQLTERINDRTFMKVYGYVRHSIVIYLPSELQKDAFYRKGGTKTSTGKNKWYPENGFQDSHFRYV